MFLPVFASKDLGFLYRRFSHFLRAGFNLRETVKIVKLLVSRDLLDWGDSNRTHRLGAYCYIYKN